MFVSKVLGTKKNLHNALPLSHFIRRQKTLDLYRRFLRLFRCVENEQQKRDLRGWIQSEFKSKKEITDKELIELHLNNGQNSLRDLETSLRHAHALKSSHTTD